MSSYLERLAGALRVPLKCERPRHQLLLAKQHLCAHRHTDTHTHTQADTFVPRARLLRVLRCRACALKNRTGVPSILTSAGLCFPLVQYSTIHGSLRPMQEESGTLTEDEYSSQVSVSLPKPHKQGLGFMGRSACRVVSHWYAGYSLKDEHHFGAFLVCSHFQGSLLCCCCS